MKTIEENLSPAPVTEDEFSASAYPKKCTPTINHLTETDDLTMMQRLEKRMPPFHKVAHVTDGKDENGLLPCPFCGGKAAVGEHYLPYSRFITNCQSCEAESSIFTTARLAIAAWNKRA